MTYTLAICDRSYSSWSLRGWLLFERFGLPVSVQSATMRTPEFARMLARFGGAARVPAVLVDDTPVWDSVAIAETLAEQNPGAGHWPADPAERALARSMVAEMHSAFGALCSACPMNLRRAYAGFDLPAEARENIERIRALWEMARARAGRGPWLFGDYSAADAFFAPVAARFATYGVMLDGADAAYVDRHLADPSFRRWRAMAMAEKAVQPHYEFDLPDRPWPGPTPLPAEPVTGQTAINAACPYSGKPVQPDSLARIDGRVVGFCNPFCRDKSVADAAAWPALVTLMDETA